MRLPPVPSQFEGIQYIFDKIASLLTNRVTAVGAERRVNGGVSQINFAVAAVTQTVVVPHGLGTQPAGAVGFPLFGGSVLTGLLMQATGWDATNVTYQAEWKDNVARVGTLNFSWWAWV